MNKLWTSLQWILCDINFYDEDANQGTSIIPFLGFMCFLIGLLVAFIGFVKRSNAKRQWSLFYDERDHRDLSDKKYEKESKVGMAMIIIGIVMMIASFFIC